MKWRVPSLAMGGTGDRAAKAALAAALLVLATIVSLVLPTAFLGENTVPNQVGTTESYAGRLLVTVTLHNSTGESQPVPGIPVVVTRFALKGLRLTMNTNGSGEVEMGLAPGQYGVSTSDPRFSVSNLVNVYTGNLTSMVVNVNRSAAYSIFAQAQDSTSDGQIATWNKLFVEVSTSQSQIYFGIFNVNGTLPVVVGSGQSNVTGRVRFGGQVFVQPVKFYGAGGFGY